MNKELTKTETTPAHEEKPRFRKPQYAVHSEDNAYRLEAHLPGVAKDAARITLDGNLLTVEAEAPQVADARWKPFRREIPEGAYKLTLELNVEIEEDAISAKAVDGVLMVTLPLAAKAAKRTIAIE